MTEPDSNRRRAGWAIDCGKENWTDLTVGYNFRGSAREIAFVLTRPQVVATTWLICWHGDLERGWVMDIQHQTVTIFKILRINSVWRVYTVLHILRILKKMKKILNVRTPECNSFLFWLIINHLNQFQRVVQYFSPNCCENFPLTPFFHLFPLIFAIFPLET